MNLLTLIYYLITESRLNLAYYANINKLLKVEISICRYFSRGYKIMEAQLAQAACMCCHGFKSLLSAFFPLSFFLSL
jgi:hypothetical protein